MKHKFTPKDDPLIQENNGKIAKNQFKNFHMIIIRCKIAEHKVSKRREKWAGLLNVLKSV